MSAYSPATGAGHREAGFSLIVVLLLLVVITVLGVGSAQLSIVNELGARSDRDHEVAFQAAEAALTDAELDVLGPNTDAKARLCLFNDKDITPFAPGCGREGASNHGLCAAAETGAVPAWMRADLSPESETSVAYGTFTGRKYATGSATTAASPRYVIEAMRNRGGWEVNRLRSASAGAVTHIFRVTAIGFGVRKETRVVLQTTLYKPAASAGCP
ncbi:PilX N-terminal domain-containing pilus assembly protein [Variovorax sp. YR216]|uniref:pilus assembly PilX family protein n=1 Tax=Variovorax sp. YR216 TaxID=1882828 RepID=UPI00089B43B3|nr:pilus assembly protein [Variovorax sp. YR216]SEA13471.1 type IV pilus assembly protein PilX [Variovorax sp. YR216]